MLSGIVENLAKKVKNILNQSEIIWLSCKLPGGVIWNIWNTGSESSLYGNFFKL